MYEPDPLVHRRRWWILAVLIVSLFTVNLDNTILNVALPTLARSLHASISQLQWMVDAYVLVFAGLLLAAGALGDRFGRRRVLVVGLVIFGVGSVASAFAPSADVLIPLRALMGVGGALITPSTLSITRHVFTMEERPKAIAIWTATAGLGIVAGPIIAGVLLDHFAWGSIFLINAPVVLIALAGIRLVVPEVTGAGAPRLDIAGALLSVGTLATLVYGTIEEPAHGWSDPLIVAAFLAAGAFAATFVAWELRTAEPMLDVRMFRRPALAGGVVAVLLSSLGMMGSMFFLSVYLQSVVGLSTLATGLGVIPLAIAMAVASPISALAWRRIGAKVTVATGLGAVAGGLLVMAQATPASGYPMVALTLALLGAGMALAGTPVTTLMIQAMPAAKAGVASAINSAARELGGALGVAVLGSIAAPIYAAQVAPVAGALPADVAGIVRDSLPSAVAVAGSLPHPVSDTILAVARASFVDGMTGAVALGALVALAGAVIAVALLPGRQARPAAAPATRRIETRNLTAA
jgi:EmrB/QacA subfamily drug resistance transporter